MAVAFDASSEVAETTGDPSWTHTPVGTPKGVLVYIGQRGVNTDQVTTVTYGGVAMTRLEKVDDNAGELLTAYLYFLGSSIPTGAQTILVDQTGGAAKKCMAISVTASGDTAVEDSNVASGDAANPSVALTTGASQETWASGFLVSGHNATSGVTAGSGFTMVLQSDTGNQVFNLERITANDAGGGVTVDFTAAIEDVAMVAVAVKEAGGGGAPSPRLLGTLGVGT